MGTTVRITDFLKNIPVRRQTALKSTGKTLSKIKKLLQAYTMCQPSKRLSLKVIKAKNETSNWMYAGGQSASLMDAAMKVVGTDVVSQCTVKKWPPEEDSAEYRIVAILAKGEAGNKLQSLVLALSNHSRFHQSQQRRPVLWCGWQTPCNRKRDRTGYHQDL